MLVMNAGMRWFCWVLFGLGMGGSACSGRLLTPDDRQAQAVQRVYLGSVHGRAPSTTSARLDANPGDPDYRLTFESDEGSLGCIPAKEVTKSILMDAAAACLKRLSTPVSVTYALDTGFPPAWVLEEDDIEFDPEVEEDLDYQRDAKACLMSSLGRIPVFREVFFLSIPSSPQKAHCWSRRLNEEVDRRLGFRWNFLRPKLSLQWDSSDEGVLSQRLLRFSLSPFLDPAGEGRVDRKLKGKPVPESLCKRCLGDSSFEKWSMMPLDSVEGPQVEMWVK